MRSFHFFRLLIGVISISAVFTACDLNQMESNNGPILLGDASTIVTEEDPQYLEDFVNDLKDQSPDNPEVAIEKDTFSNVAQAQQLAKQQAQDSIKEITEADKLKANKELQEKDKAKQKSKKQQKEATKKKSKKIASRDSAKDNKSQKTNTKAAKDKKNKKGQERKKGQR